MKGKYPNVSLVRFCRLLGVTPQAYYQHIRRFEERTLEAYLVTTEVRSIRENHRRMGVRKLYEKLEPFMLDHQIKMGRDALFALLAEHSLLVRRRRNRVRTTNSNHWFRKYPNLIEGLSIVRKNQLWVSDLTYWKASGINYYVSFVKDAYSKKIVGWHVATNLEAKESRKALSKAIQGLDKREQSGNKLIHHSDLGIQYCSKEYVQLLQDKGIGISMTQNGDPRENAVAERINGILKNEYLFDLEVKDLCHAQQLLDKAVNLYNQERPHLSIGMLTPEKVHSKNIHPEKLWKNYYEKRTTNQPILGLTLNQQSIPGINKNM